MGIFYVLTIVIIFTKLINPLLEDNSRTILKYLKFILKILRKVIPRKCIRENSYLRKNIPVLHKLLYNSDSFTSFKRITYWRFLRNAFKAAIE